ncbi:conserved exported hypothetical protein [Paraburkholderia ribeironis]|uniref:Uncharacterized protein n=1 Tax=Paraburkholderia ribeironis TaxID=1247936 RepID=A0A1N7SMW2_9BURK|nr:hypothetical protein [Paraburkholderia ribeironis]SIT48768.1 conserved exported hypothetical protein [Paraburkholderia ribeironis]
MTIMNRFAAWYLKFNALSFFARRAIIFAASVALWWFAAMLQSMHFNNDLCVVMLLAGTAGVLWSSELWRLWKVFAAIVVICLAIMR